MVDGSRALEAVRAAPVVLIGLLLLASAWWDGAFDLRYWAPLALLALAMLLALVLSGGLSLPRRGPAAASLVAIWGLAAFALLSVAWSDSPAGAWEGAARTALYAGLFTLAVAAAGRGPWGRWLGGALVVGVAMVGAVALARILFEGADVFLAGRLNAPIGYRNGTAALFAFAAWPLLGLAARRGVPSGGRAASFAAVALLLGLAFLTQSRGVLIGFAAGAAVSLAIGPDRIRRAWLALAALGAVAVASGTLLTPFDAFGAGEGTVSDADVRSAGTALLLLTGASFLGSLFLFVLDNGLRTDLLARIRARQLATVGLATLVGVAGIVALARVGNPVSYADEKLDEFTSLETGTEGGSGVRLGTVSGQRYDLYRVAWEEFREQPPAGGGEGSYEFAYYRERSTDRNLSAPHSLPLRLLAETGLVGFALFAAWLVGVGAAIARRARLSDGRDRVWVAGLAAAGATVLAQSFVDWLWLLPGVLGLGFLALGLAAAGWGADSATDEGSVGGSEPRAGRWAPGRIAATAALALALGGVTSLFLADLYVRKARAESLRSAEATLDAARTAGRLNPLSVTPLYLEASALETLGDRRAARDALEEALAQEPENFVTLGLLGDLETRGGNERLARRYYRRALGLNPRDIGLRDLSGRR